MSAVRCEGVRNSGKPERIRPDTEMSARSTVMPWVSVKRLMMGRRAYVARAGASSVMVHIILVGLDEALVIIAGLGVMKNLRWFARVVIAWPGAERRWAKQRGAS